MSRNICRFWQSGYCKFGGNCKFEHPSRGQQQPTSNRFAALSGGNQTQMGSQRGPELPYSLSKEVLRRDLTEDRSSWPLSCYGPGRDAPEQLFGGYPREQSFEEIRLHYMQGVLAGNEQGVINEIAALYQSSQQQIQAAIENLDGALQYIVDSGNNHPNRIDICKQNTIPGGTTGVFAVGRQQPSAFGGPSTAFGAPSTAFGAPANALQGAAQQSSPFGAPSAQTSSGFGQPSGLGQRPSAFGAPAFGQPSQPAQPGSSTSAFGKPSQPASAFGQPFGQPSTLGAKPSPFGAPAFGQPSQPAGAPAFGQPSQPGTTSAFGQPSQPGTTSAFGQPSQPGTTSAFGQPSQPGTTSAFGQPSLPGSAPAFGQPSQPSSAFGQPSGLGQKPNPFGAPSSNQSAFASAGAAAAPSQSPFGQPSQPQQPPSANPFGGQQSQAASNPFGQPSTSSGVANPPPAAANPFGQPQQPKPNPFGPGPSAGGAFANAMDTATNGTGPAPSPFGAPSAAAGNTSSNPFQQAAQGSATAGFASTSGSATPAAGAAPSQGQGPYGPGATRQHPAIESYSSREADGRLRMFKGKAVTYQPNKAGGGDKLEPVLRGFDGSVTRIWFPNGAPPYSADTEAEGGKYDSEEVMAPWRAFVQTGRFADGVMPEVPPKREFCSWDF